VQGGCDESDGVESPWGGELVDGGTVEGIAADRSEVVYLSRVEAHSGGAALLSSITALVCGLVCDRFGNVLFRQLLPGVSMAAAISSTFNARPVDAL